MSQYKFGAGIPTYNGIPMIGGIPPIAGKYFHVNPRIGLDGNKGIDSSKPLDSFVKAEDLLTTDVGDGIIVWSQGNTAANTTSYLTTPMAFNKSGCTVFGIHSGQMFYGRARIAAGADDDLAYLIDISGSNNSFYNLHFANYGDGTGALGCGRLTGDRNFFYNCHFVGAGHATPGAVSLNPGTTYGAHDFLLSSSENMFVNCTFGSNSIIRASSSANIIIGAQQSKNHFVNCRTFVNSTTPGVGAIGLYATNVLNGWLTFDNCLFTCWYANEIDTNNTSLMIGSEPTNSGLLMHNSGFIGWSEWDDAGTSKVYTTMPQSNAAGGKGVAAG